MVLIGTLAVIGSGCFRTDVSYVLHEDRSGSVSHATTFDLSALLADESATETAATMRACARVLDDSRDARSSAAIFGNLEPVAETINDGAACSEALQASWTPGQFEDVVDAIASSGGSRITRRNNGAWKYNLSWPPQEAEVWQRNAYQFDETSGVSPTLGISVDLPGGSATHNSTLLIIALRELNSSGDIDEVNDAERPAVLSGPFTWQLGLRAPENESAASSYEMFAHTYPTANAMSIQGVLGVAAIVLLIIAALMLPFLSRWRSARAKMSADDAYPQPVAEPSRSVPVAGIDDGAYARPVAGPSPERRSEHRNGSTSATGR